MAAPQLNQGCACTTAPLAKSGGSKGKEALIEGPRESGETFGCLARARGEAP